MPKTIFVPPGGFAGFAQQTPATQALVSRPAARKRKAPVRKKRRKTTAKKRTRRPARRTSTKPRRRTTRKKPARMVKGSAAAKRHMAKLRRMRRKR